jgi:hypothetical protein
MSYDFPIDLFECFKNYLSHLRIFSKILPAMEGVLIKIMVELLAILALAMQQIKQGQFCEFVLLMLHSPWLSIAQRNLQKELLGRNDVETVVHGLFSNMKGYV